MLRLAKRRVTTAFEHWIPDLGAEADGKRVQVREVLSCVGADGFAAADAPTVRWLLCGRGDSVPDRTLTVMVAAADAIVLCPESECARVIEEERLDELGYRLAAYPWDQGPHAAVDEFLGDRRARNRQLGAMLAGLRSRLLPSERERLRGAGRACAEALAATFEQLHPEMPEREAAAMLGFELAERRVRTAAIAVAGEVRLLAYTRAPATAAPLRRYALLGLRGERDGLTITMTRVVSFVEPSTVLSSRVAVAAEIEARMLTASTPGSSISSILAAGAEAYAAFGFAGESNRHCQGGLGGYTYPSLHDDPPLRDARLPESCAVSWRPLLPGGGASQDTVLVAPAGLEVVTWIPEQPEQRTSGLPRPAIVPL